MLKLVFLILFIYSTNYAQNSNILPDENIIGLVHSSEGIFLELENGFIQLESYDVWEEYYRMIYNDSTIVNPNTEIKNDIDLNIIPFILPQTTQRKIEFSEPLALGLFLEFNDYGQLSLTSFGNEVVDSLTVDE